MSQTLRFNRDINTAAYEAYPFSQPASHNNVSIYLVGLLKNLHSCQHGATVSKILNILQLSLFNHRHIGSHWIYEQPAITSATKNIIVGSLVLYVTAQDNHNQEMMTISRVL